MQGTAVHNYKYQDKCKPNIDMFRMTVWQYGGGDGDGDGVIVLIDFFTTEV